MDQREPTFFLVFLSVFAVRDLYFISVTPVLNRVGIEGPASRVHGSHCALGRSSRPTNGCIMGATLTGFFGALFGFITGGVTGVVMASEMGAGSSECMIAGGIVGALAGLLGGNIGGEMGRQKKDANRL